MVIYLLSSYLDISSAFQIDSFENNFLVIMGLIWIVCAVIQDFRKREVANWWNFSLIVLALSFRAFVSINQGSWSYLLWGLFGLACGFLVHNLFYYARIFAGGDAKLLLALCTILPFGLEWRLNLAILLIYLVLILISGAVYGLVYSLILVIMHFKSFSKEFGVVFRVNKKAILFMLLFSLILGTIFYYLNFILGVMLCALLFFTPFLLVSAKSIEKTCMIKEVKVKDLTIGDWTVNPLSVGKRTINPNWEGLSEKEIKIIKNKLNKNKKVIVREGIPFTPSFLFALILLVWI